MKNLQGLIIALALGIAAALLNWAYLNSAAREVEKVEFIGVKPGVTIARGERLAEEHFVAVPIPKNNVGSLDGYAIRYSNLSTVTANRNAARTLTGGTLLLEHDLRTPPQELRLKKTLDPKTLEQMGLPLDADAEELAMFVPVDTRTFVPALVKPGDQVSFWTVDAPTVAGPSGGMPATVPMVGPFRVLAVGNRLSSADVMKAAGVAQTQENVMTISIGRVRGGGGTKSRLDDRTIELLGYLRATNYRGMGVTLHPREE